MENRCLGDYQIIKQIGRGTLGRVYLAEQRFMKSQFVIKVLPNELASDRGFVQRFEKEMSALSTLDHPHIVKIHNVSFAEGVYFLVLDCVVDELGESTNLTQFIQSQQAPLKEKELFSLLNQVAAALDYAHQKKVGGKPIAHRCLKPNNILVSKGPDGVNLQVSDFGLSRIVGIGHVLTQTFRSVAEAMDISTEEYAPSSQESKKLSSLHNSFLQNFFFLAPEQKLIETADKAGIKSDTYAFGVLAYYLMTQSYPEGVFPYPTQLGLGYQSDWDTLINQCLQKDPKSRPDNLTQLLKEIEGPKGRKQELGSQEHAAASKLQVKVPEKVKVGVEKKELKPIIHSSQIDRPDMSTDPTENLNVDSTVKVYHPEEQKVADVQPLMTDMVIIKGVDTAGMSSPLICLSIIYNPDCFFKFTIFVNS